MVKEDVFDLLVTHIKEVIPELSQCTMVYSDEFGTFGINSTDRAEILCLTIESLSLDTPMALVEVYHSHTLGELVDLLFKKLQVVEKV